MEAIAKNCRSARVENRLAPYLAGMGSVLVLAPAPAQARMTEFVSDILHNIESGVSGDLLDRAALQGDFENIGADLHAACRRLEAHVKEKERQ